METKFTPQEIENKLYRFWEEKGYFTAEVDKAKKPFSIVLPPPNANADLHMGHAMYVYEDVIVRYHHLLGDETLWLPGADHAGFETQFVFEKHLQKEGKSRFDFDRETLFKMIWDFVMKNKGCMEDQLRRLGFALDWSKRKFTMDADIVRVVYETFKKLYDAGLLYRAKRLVNYCTFCGTSFSDLEVIYKERTDPLYYMKYGPFTLATTRPETKFGDTAVAVNPKDKRYQKWIGQVIEVEGLAGKFKVKVVADEAVDPKFGTGVVKVTPAHDFADFEMGHRHQLEMKQVIGYDGKLNRLAGPYAGLYVNQARKKVAEDLQARGLMVKIKEDYKHRVGTCYKCSRIIEPMPLEQWFIRVRPLAEVGKKLIKEGRIKIYPKRFEKIFAYWFDNFQDWNISRQVVWGIRIPAYYCRDCKKWFVSVDKPTRCQVCKGIDFVQDSDTFDTWFSSSQWPFATLKTTDGKEFFDYYYPTTVMETGYDILPWWVARMIMIGYFATKKVPFQNVFLHGLIRDKLGRKMSKSKGNVINPIEMVDKYGADALRTALLFEVKEGSDVVIAEEKIVGMRNFANKVWNMGRFIYINRTQNSNVKTQNPDTKITKELNKEFKKIQKDYKKYMDNYQFSKALGLVYELMWHRLADYYIEVLKNELKNGNINALESLLKVYLGSLKLLHPFAPFVTEAIWKVFRGEEASILNERL
jgi:valyl-tRNA synthetase